jgi:hypothetical protein
MTALSEIKRAGFVINLNGGDFVVTPSKLLTDRQRDFLKSHKAEIITELQAEALAAKPVKQKPVTCGKCLHFKSHYSHGKGAGRCLVGGAYGSWSETQHYCTKFDAAVEWVVMPDPSPNAIMVTVYTPNGNAIEIEARDEAHAVSLQQMNPKPPQGILK